MMAGISRMVRKSCTECGKSDLQWGTLDEMRASLGPERGDLNDLRRFMSGKSEMWMCRDCGNFGVFGPTVFERG